MKHISVMMIGLMSGLHLINIASVLVPVGTGELVDKITILEIKLERIADGEKLKHIQYEHQALMNSLDQNLTSSMQQIIAPITQQLLETNKKLWDIENSIRRKEACQEFDAEFIQLARAVYRNNRTRQQLKQQINEASQSDIIEQKQYTEFS